MRWHNVEVTVEVVVSDDLDRVDDIPESVFKEARRKVSTALDGNGFWFTVRPKVRLLSTAIEEDKKP